MPGLIGGEARCSPNGHNATEMRPPGTMRSKPIKHRARDAQGLADLRPALPFRSNQSERRGTQDFDKPRCREASRPAGPFGPLASRAPSVLCPGDADLPPDDGAPGAAKKQGGGALACRAGVQTKAGCLTSESDEGERNTRRLVGWTKARISAFTRVSDALWRRAHRRRDTIGESAGGLASLSPPYELDPRLCGHCVRRFA